MKKDRPVIKGLLMISQIGISMIVPIFLGAFLGYQLDRWLGKGFFFLIFLLFGILAAFRNIYKLTKPFYAEDLARERKEQDYWRSLKAGGEESPKDAPPNPPGWQERRRRLAEQGNEEPQGAVSLTKSRRQIAEEEFSMWRREREKGRDGGSSHDSERNRAEE
ncbi:MAG: AtpZ/AtpI family protein [Lachnospiraceae bacterium]|nr:AtpZ/AtpI family protein [Lachnospiraceae bacterium]